MGQKYRIRKKKNGKAKGFTTLKPKSKKKK